MLLMLRSCSRLLVTLLCISTALAITKQNISIINLSTAENWLIRNELVDIYKAAVVENLVPQYLSYQANFYGEPPLLDALASFFNTYFKPHIPVETSHLATSSGAAGALDALFYQICDPGDGFLVPGPYWSGFDYLLRRRSFEPILVNVENLDETFTSSLIPALSKAFDESNITVKGVLLTNPGNPIGQRYPRSVIEACVKFCQERNIHFISDELYALSEYPSSDLQNAVPFTSALQLDTKAIGADLSRVHTVWSFSKDFGSSGLRMGVIVSQGNQSFLATVASPVVSSLSTIATTALLKSSSLSDLIKLNSERLGESYKVITSFFKRHRIEYKPANAGLYILAKLAPDAKTWDDEARVVQSLKDAGVLVNPGKAYHLDEKEKGWARVLFAVEPSVLREGLRRLEMALQLPHISLSNETGLEH